jgi:metal-responsive CopG/Arc/MetJ family transcriptional regulator
MPNSPAKDTVRISFTLPRKLNQLIEDRANAEMTNISDIIRRALRTYFDSSFQQSSKTAKVTGSQNVHIKQ